MRAITNVEKARSSVKVMYISAPPPLERSEPSTVSLVTLNSSVAQYND